MSLSPEQDSRVLVYTLSVLSRFRLELKQQVAFKLLEFALDNGI
jgi:hypothetical protein